MKASAANHCPRCGQRLLAPDETVQQTEIYLVRVQRGQLHVRCKNRYCRRWFPMPVLFLALLRLVLSPEEEPAWKT